MINCIAQNRLQNLGFLYEKKSHEFIISTQYHFPDGYRYNFSVFKLYMKILKGSSSEFLLTLARRDRVYLFVTTLTQLFIRATFLIYTSQVILEDGV